MAGFIKNERQIEFSELLEKSGLSQADIARRLKVSRASITRYLKGEQTPAPSKLELLRRIVNEMKPGTETKYPVQPESVIFPQTSEINDAIRELAQIRETAPDQFRAVRDVIAAHHRALPKREVSSVHTPKTGEAQIVAEVERLIDVLDALDEREHAEELRRRRDQYKARRAAERNREISSPSSDASRRSSPSTSSQKERPE